VKFCAETPQVTASSYLPTVLPLSDVERLLPVSLTPDPY